MICRSPSVYTTVSSISFGADSNASSSSGAGVVEGAELHHEPHDEPELEPELFATTSMVAGS